MSDQNDNGYYGGHQQYGQPGQYQPGQYGQPAQYPYNQPGGYGMPSPYGPYPQARSRSNTLSIIGIVCGAISFLFFPILFGPAGLVLGAVAKGRNERLATVAMTVSGVGLLIGMILGVLVWTSL